MHQAKKQGFSAPDESWFRGRSEEYIKDLLLSSGARINEFFDADFITKTVSEHIKGESNKRLLLWSFLSFEHWLRIFR